MHATAPIGTIPFVVAFAIVKISGVTPNSWEANAEPVLPQPVITSSKIKSIPCLSQISLNLCKYPFGGTKVPVDPAIGSTIQADIFSDPKFVQILSKSFAISAPVSGCPEINLCSGKWVCLMWTTPGIKIFANVFILLIIPPTDVPPICMPWYARSLPTILNLSPCPLALW